MALIGIFFTILAPLIPSLLWLFFFLKEDIHPEPHRLVMRAFNFGALASIPVLVLQIIFQQAFGGLESIMVIIIGLAFIEELFKFFAARGAIVGNKEFDEPTDAMIYMIVAALGFATVENFFITVQSLHAIGSFPLIEASQTLALRFMGATLLHAIASGTIGYYWAQSRITGHRVLLAGGVVFATAIHAIFNYLIFHFENANLIYPSIFLLIALALLFIDFDKLKIYDLRRWNTRRNSQ